MKIKLTLAAFALATLFLGAGVARADSVNQYITDLRSRGVLVPDDQKMTEWAIGLAVCVDLFSGAPVVKEVQAVAGPHTTVNDAEWIVAAAVTDLCPKAAPRSTT